MHPREGYDQIGLLSLPSTLPQCRPARATWAPAAAGAGPPRPTARAAPRDPPRPRPHGVDSITRTLNPWRRTFIRQPSTAFLCREPVSAQTPSSNAVRRQVTNQSPFSGTGLCVLLHSLPCSGRTPLDMHTLTPCIPSCDARLGAVQTYSGPSQTFGWIRMSWCVRVACVPAVPCVCALRVCACVCLCECV